MVVSLSYNLEVPIYECPRCRGNDVYFGTRQEIKYTSGAFPEQYLANVQKALCRQCAEPMTNKGPTPQEAKAAQDVVEAKVNFIFSKTIFNGWFNFLNYLKKIIIGKDLETHV